MKPCAFDNQELLDHAKGSVEKMRWLFDDNYFRVVGKRLGISKEQAEGLIEFLSAFHDLGKAAELYQEQFDDQCNAKRGNTSFIFHELGGALFLWYNQWTDETPQTLKVMSTLSVLNHLNAIRNFSGAMGSVRKVKIGHLKLKKYGESVVEKLIEQGFKNPFMTTYEVKDYSITDLQDMFSQISQFATHKNNLKLYVLLLTPVIVGDNLDSTTSREKDESYSSKSRFISSLLKEVKMP